MGNFTSSQKLNSKTDETKLLMASLNGNLDACKYLIENKNIDINCVSGYNTNPFFNSVIGGHIEIMKYLYKNGANINIVDEGQMTPLTHSYLYDEPPFEKLELLCKWNGYIIHKFLYIKRSYQEERIKLLCKYDIIESKYCMLLAVSHGNYDICKYLIDNTDIDINQPLDIKQPLDNNFTLLMVACKYGHNNIAELLYNNGADITFMDINGFIACHYATNPYLSKLLDPNYQNTINIKAA